MKCDICKKNEATIHIQEIMNGKKKNLNICSSCASEKNIAESNIDGFNLSEILYNLSSQMMNASQEHQEENLEDELSDESIISQHAGVVCSKCGWNTARFRETGRLGCANCYKVFEPVLRNAIANMHKGNIHLGKHPKTVEGSNAEMAMKLMSLQKELEQHVKREEYEEAAKIRDRINDLKKGNKKK